MQCFWLTCGMLCHFLNLLYFHFNEPHGVLHILHEHSIVVCINTEAAELERQYLRGADFSRHV